MAKYTISQACILTKVVEADSLEDATIMADWLGDDDFDDVTWGDVTVVESTDD